MGSAKEAHFSELTVYFSLDFVELGLTEEGLETVAYQHVKEKEWDNSSVAFTSDKAGLGIDS
jgi:hypothetical protein